MRRIFILKQMFSKKNSGVIMESIKAARLEQTVHFRCCRHLADQLRIFHIRTGSDRAILKITNRAGRIGA